MATKQRLLVLVHLCEDMLPVAYNIYSQRKTIANRKILLKNFVINISYFFLNSTVNNQKFKMIVGLLKTTFILVLFNFAEAQPDNEDTEIIMQFAIAARPKLGFSQLTFVDFYEEMIVDQREGISISFVTSEELLNSDYILETYADEIVPAAFILKTHNPELLKKAGKKGQLESQNWFLPKISDIEALNLRLDSHVYLYEIENDTVLVDEVYAIKNGPKIQNEIGRFNETHGFTMDNENIWERRKNLGGITLENLTLRKFNFLPLVDMRPDPDSDKIQVTGYQKDVLLQLGKIMNFSVVNKLSVDGQFGAKNPNGSWNGMVGMLTRNDGDVCIAGFAITNARSKVIDFSLPLFRQSWILMTQKPKGKLFNVWAYMEALGLVPWAVLVAVLLGLAFGFLMISRMDPHAIHNPYDSERFGILNAIGLVMIALLQRDYHINKSKSSVRLLFVVTCLSTYMIFAYYSAVLTSSMTVLEPQNQLKSYNDIITYSYNMLVLRGSNFETFLKESKPPSIFHEIYEKRIKNNPVAILDSFADIMDTVVKDSKSVYFGPWILNFANPDWYPLELPGSPRNNFNAMGLRKHSEFTAIFNYFILKMRQSGLMNKMLNKWVERKVVENEMGIEANPLSYDNLLFPYLILSVGTLAALVLVTLEWIFGFSCSNYFSNRQNRRK